MRNAFTMIELIFVIVVIGILSAVAVPKFAGVADTAHTSKAKSTVASIRSALATERQKRILRGEFNSIVKLDNGIVSAGDPIFNSMVDSADNDTGIAVFDYSMKACESGHTGCWTHAADNTVYRYIFPDGTHVDFNVTQSKFVCDETDDKCKLLIR